MQDHAIAIAASSGVALLCITIIGLGFLNDHERALGGCAAAMFAGLLAATIAASDKASKEALKGNDDGNISDSDDGKVHGLLAKDWYIVAACTAGAAVLLAALQIWLAWKQAVRGDDSPNIIRPDNVASVATWLATAAALASSVAVSV